MHQLLQRDCNDPGSPSLPLAAQVAFGFGGGAVGAVGTAFTPCTASQAPYSSHLHPLGFARHLGDRHRRFGSTSLLVRIRTSKQINTTYPLLQQIPSPLDVDSAAPVRGIQRQANKAYSYWPQADPSPHLTFCVGAVRQAVQTLVVLRKHHLNLPRNLAGIRGPLRAMED